MSCWEVVVKRGVRWALCSGLARSKPWTLENDFYLSKPSAPDTELSYKNNSFLSHENALK